MESRGRSPARMAVAKFANSAEEVMQMTDFNPDGLPEVMDLYGNDIELIQTAKAVYVNALEGPAARLA